MRGAALVAIIAAGALVAPVAAPQPASAAKLPKKNKRAARAAADWLASQDPETSVRGGQLADAVVGLVAAKKAVGTSVPPLFVNELAKQTPSYSSNSPGAAAKVALAAVAGGQNPYCFGGVDLIARINSDYDGKGRYGTSSFDQALSMLAIEAAGGDVPNAAVRFLVKRRGKNGWGFTLSRGPGDDIESSSLVIEALRAAGLGPKDRRLRAAWRWVAFQANAQGGYNPKGKNAAGDGGATQANTTAYALRAAKALRLRTQTKTERALTGLQRRSGAVNPQATPGAKEQVLLSTIDAIPAYARRAYPVARGSIGLSCTR